MSKENQPVWHWPLRIGVLGFAVAVGVFIVRQNHEAAQPKSEPEGVAPASPETPSEPPVARRGEEPSGREGGAETLAPERMPERDPVFFHTSKSMAPDEKILELVKPETINIPTPPTPSKQPAGKPYFHSSKAFEPPPIQIPSPQRTAP